MLSGLNHLTLAVSDLAACRERPYKGMVFFD